MIRRGRFPLLILTAIVLFGCREGESPCARPPLGEVTVFVEGESGIVDFAGRVETIEPPQEDGLWTYRIRQDDEGIRVLRFGAPADSLPVETGRVYRFQVATVPGMPTPNSVLVREGDRFLFAGASDYRPGERVFEAAPAGFEIALESAGCADRTSNPCFESEINGQLLVACCGETVRLFHGESAVVDGVRVTCLTARFLEYSDQCADAGAFGVSYTLRRMTDSNAAG